MSKLGFTALVVTLGVLMFRVLVGAAFLLYYICKIAVLLPVALFALLSGSASIAVSRTDPDARPRPPKSAAVPAVDKPAPAPEIGPASIPTTGDWRQDRKILEQMLAEGKIPQSKGR